MWPFSRRHKPEDAPTVKQARHERDEVLADLADANEMVDAVHDRVIADYEAAETQRLRGRR